MDIEDIRTHAKNKNIKWSTHSLKRLDERQITVAECMRCLLEGEIIEDYPTDYPFPSCLMMEKGKPLHLVCSIGEGSLIIITAYIPDANEWHDDLKARKKQ